MVKGKLENIHYQAMGQKMMMDTISVNFIVDGRRYTHNIPNKGWGYNNPALQFFGYLDIKPTDIEGTQYSFKEDVMCPVAKNEDGYELSGNPFKVGKYFLQESDWFNPKGSVWNSGESKAFGGMNVEPGTGNRAAVDGEE